MHAACARRQGRACSNRVITLRQGGQGCHNRGAKVEGNRGIPDAPDAPDAPEQGDAGCPGTHHIADEEMLDSLSRGGTRLVWAMVHRP